MKWKRDGNELRIAMEASDDYDGPRVDGEWKSLTELTPADWRRYHDAFMRRNAA